MIIYEEKWWFVVSIVTYFICDSNDFVKLYNLFNNYVA